MHKRISIHIAEKQSNDCNVHLVFDTPCNKHPKHKNTPEKAQLRDYISTTYKYRIERIGQYCDQIYIHTASTPDFIINNVIN